MGLLQQAQKKRTRQKIQHILDKIYDNFPAFVFTLFILIFLIGVATQTAKAQNDPIINGTTMINDPFNTLFSPFTNFFEGILGPGLGAAFFLLPVTVLALGVYVKTNDIVTTSMFLLLTGALLFTGSIMAGIPEMGIIFIIFTAMGIVSLFIGIIFQRRTA